MEDFDKKNQVGQVYLTISELMRKLRVQKLKVANKLHCQFGHASPEKLKNLIKASNIHDQELLSSIDLVDQNCQVCLNYKKPNLRPVVSFSLSKEFNNVVAADLKSINGILILNMINHATRFSAAASSKVKRKKKLLMHLYGIGLLFLEFQA